MLTSLLIAKKRDGQEMTREEIDFLIQGYAKDEVPDYQMSAWAMAVFLKGMNRKETEFLTQSMLHSGDVLKPCSDRPRVDKHSTGGLGDKTSLILAPLLSLFDLDVPMLSGRGLGITGGTLDKLEAIPGFRTNLSESEIEAGLKENGCVITGASTRLVPADRKLYGLRDVTATVPSIPLITGSIMSKKLAESLHALVLDVKWGSGAFMQQRDNAIRLGHSLRSTGESMGVPTQAILSDMNQPLGRMVGNACEVNESLELLKGNGPADALTLTLELAVPLLIMTGRCESRDGALSTMNEHLASGRAIERFHRMVRWQGGSLVGPLPLAKSFEFPSSDEGYCCEVNGQLLGQAVILLGGGRKVASDVIDPSVGLEILIRIGDRVERGMPLFNVMAKNQDDYEKIQPLLFQALKFSPVKIAIPRLWEMLPECNQEALS